ncbi:MAG: hypothetical protein Q7T54_02685 [Candidatus Levybacteria bacterium]|nr:hypothetical protein [Candidatus Levybacteria bacterium]
MGAEKPPIPRAFIEAFPDWVDSTDNSELSAIFDRARQLTSGKQENLKPPERIWKATIPVVSALKLVNFLDQNYDAILQDFGKHGIDIDGERLGLVQNKLHDFRDRCGTLSDGNLLTPLSDLRILREVKRHLPHVGASRKMQREYRNNYRKVVGPFGKVVKESKKK